MLTHRPEKMTTGQDGQVVLLYPGGQIVPYRICIIWTSIGGLQRKECVSKGNTLIPEANIWSLPSGGDRDIDESRSRAPVI